MHIDVLTLFPEMYECLTQGIIGRALENDLFSLRVTNIRDYSLDKHKKCDDYPFGGGAGMVMTPQPIHDCIKAVDGEHNARRIYLSPRGRKLSQKVVEEYAGYDRLLFLCGSYEGIDERIIELDIDEELSIGDYVTTSGDLPCMVVINAVARYIPNVLGSTESTVEESFAGSGLLEYPQYTRPQAFEGLTVPEVLLSGNHGEIAKYRLAESMRLTALLRPDLLEKRDE